MVDFDRAIERSVVTEPAQDPGYPSPWTDWTSQVPLARARWPTVDWPESHFLSHAKTVAPDGCLHPTDVYLSGAAGYWYEASWAVLEGEIRESFLKVVSRNPKYRLESETPEDLWTVTRIRLASEVDDFPALDAERARMSRGPAAIIRFRGDARIRNYCLQIVYRYILDQREKRSPLYVAPDHFAARSAEPSRPQGSDAETRERALRLLSDALAPFSTADRALLVGVVVRQLDQKVVGRALGMAEHTVSRRLKAIRGAIFETFGMEASVDARDDADAVLSALTFFLRDLQAASPNPSSSREAPRQRRATAEAPADGADTR